MTQSANQSTTAKGMLGEILGALGALDDQVRKNVIAEATEATKHMKWLPSPGPQTSAYFSEADILLFGGEPGGGKSQLLLGLAFNQHRRSLVMRRQYTDLGHLVEQALKIHGSRNGFNGSPPPKLRLEGGKQIEFFAAAKPGDEEHRQGNPFDLLAVDEATQFSESQIKFLMGWLRCAEDPNQRKRVVFATNPPLSAEGLWVNEWFAPWLDDKFPNPAEPGEIRWAINGEDDKLIWVDGPEPVEYNGRTIKPKSYTFIPSSMSDNPYLANSGYDKELDNLPNEIRSILMGGFKTTFRDQPFQAIPTDWIRAAQERWTERPPIGVPQCAIGVDCSGGGNDPMIMAIRHDGWFGSMIEIPAKEIPIERAGSHAAGIIVSYRRDNSIVVVDMGGGYGGSTYETLRTNEIDAMAYKGAETSVRRTKDGQLRFYNKRSEIIWKFREALDPSQPGGSPIMLPPDPQLLADLSAPTFKPDAAVLQIEPKEDVCKRLGRSTDRGDAVCMAWYAGPTYVTDGKQWAEGKTSGGRSRPQVVMGRSNRR